MDGQRVFRAPLPADSAGAGPSAPAPAHAVPPSTSRTITDTIIGGKEREKEKQERRESPCSCLFFLGCRHCLFSFAKPEFFFFFPSLFSDRQSDSKPPFAPRSERAKGKAASTRLRLSVDEVERMDRMERARAK